MYGVLTRGAAGLGAGLTLALLTSCGHSGPSLTPGLDENGKLVTSVPRVTEGAARIHQGDTVTIGGMYACLDESGSVTIDDVAAVGEIGLEQTGWAIRPNPSWQPSPTTGRGQLGISRNTLAKLQFPVSRTANVKCGSLGQGYEFGVEVRKTTSGEAGLSEFKVTYTSGGDARTFVFHFAIKLCNEKVAWARPCRKLKV